jgi:hypothetical protein
MALFDDMVGVSVGTSDATASLIKVVTMSGSGVVSGLTSVSASPLLLITTSGSSDGQSSILAGNIIRISLPIGVSLGSTTLVQPQISKFTLLSGEAVGLSSTRAFYTDKDILKLMQDVLPDFLINSKTVKSIQEAQGIESTRLFALVEQLLLDFLIDTASADGLAIREKELKIQPQSDKTITQRRLDLKLKQRPAELLTKQRFKGQLDHYHICKVEERPNEFEVISTIIGKRGIPEDIANMERAVERILPAHLIHEFIYTWLPWHEVKEAGLTWIQAKQLTWGELRTSFLVPFDESEY